MNYRLFYLADQTDLIDGAKYLVGEYLDLASAQNKANADGISHFSVELVNEQGTTIIFIV